MESRLAILLSKVLSRWQAMSRMRTERWTFGVSKADKSCSEGELREERRKGGRMFGPPFSRRANLGWRVLCGQRREQAGAVITGGRCGGCPPAQGRPLAARPPR